MPNMVHMIWIMNSLRLTGLRQSHMTIHMPMNAPWTFCRPCLRNQPQHWVKTLVGMKNVAMWDGAIINYDVVQHEDAAEAIVHNTGAEEEPEETVELCEVGGIVISTPDSAAIRHRKSINLRHTNLIYNVHFHLHQSRLHE